MLNWCDELVLPAMITPPPVVLAPVSISALVLSQLPVPVAPPDTITVLAFTTVVAMIMEPATVPAPVLTAAPVISQPPVDFVIPTFSARAYEDTNAKIAVHGSFHVAPTGGDKEAAYTPA